MKSKKKSINMSIKKNYKTKKGGSKLIRSVVPQDIIGKALGGKDKVCDMERDLSYKDRVKMSQNLGYTKKRLKRKIDNHSLLNEKSKIFIEDYLKPSFKNFCIELDKQKYLKFCINILKCIIDNENLIETFYKIYNINDKQKENIFEFKKHKDRIEAIKDKYSVTENDGKMEENIEAEKELIIKNAQKEYIESFAKFLDQVLLKSITKYHSDKPGKAQTLTITKTLFEIFKQLQIDIFKDKKFVDWADILINGGLDESKIIEILSKDGVKDTIEKIYSGDIVKDEDNSTKGISLDDHKKNKSPFFLFWIIGGLTLSSLLYMDLLDTPPGVSIPKGFM